MSIKTKIKLTYLYEEVPDVSGRLSRGLHVYDVVIEGVLLRLRGDVSE